MDIICNVQMENSWLKIPWIAGTFTAFRSSTVPRNPRRTGGTFASGRGQHVSCSRCHYSWRQVSIFQSSHSLQRVSHVAKTRSVRLETELCMICRGAKPLVSNSWRVLWLSLLSRNLLSSWALMYAPRAIAQTPWMIYQPIDSANFGIACQSQSLHSSAGIFKVEQWST